jgi:hypothetical protein
VKQSSGRKGYISSWIRNREKISKLHFRLIKFDFDSNAFTKGSRSNPIYNYEGSRSSQVVAS